LPKNLEKKWPFLLKTKLNCEKIGSYVTLVFEKNANFFAENWQKSQKIVVITSTAVVKSFFPECYSNVKYKQQPCHALPTEVLANCTYPGGGAIYIRSVLGAVVTNP
jgi:hypothetical protein